MNSGRRLVNWWFFGKIVSWMLIVVAESLVGWPVLSLALAWQWWRQSQWPAEIIIWLGTTAWLSIQYQSPWWQWWSVGVVVRFLGEMIGGNQYHRREWDWVVIWGVMSWWGRQQFLGSERTIIYGVISWLILILIWRWPRLVIRSKSRAAVWVKSQPDHKV